MKSKELDFNYNTFNDKKFVRRFKKVVEHSFIVCKLKLLSRFNEANLIYKDICKSLTSIIRDPRSFENEAVYFTIFEITAFMDFLNDFRESVKDVKTDDGLKLRHDKYFERMGLLKDRLKQLELFVKTQEVPKFIRDLTDDRNES